MNEKKDHTQHPVLFTCPIGFEESLDLYDGTNLEDKLHIFIICPLPLIHSTLTCSKAKMLTCLLK